MFRWEKLKDKLPPRAQTMEIQWREENFLENTSWIEASFIFLHWTAFSSAQKLIVTNILKQCLEGTHVITFSSPLVTSDYLLLLSDKCDTSWGKVDFYFHEKVIPAATANTNANALT
jgi:hypothetical protein